MGEVEKDLPRVVIRKGQTGPSIQFNFQAGLAGLDEAKKSVGELLGLAKDWLNYCVASLQYSPIFSGAGFFLVGHKITEDVFKFVDEICISKEETQDEESGEAIFSFIIHEEDVNEVAKKMETTGQMIRAAESLSRSTLGSIISEFEYFLQRFVKIVAKKNPEKFYDPNEKISLGELIQVGTLEAIIEKRV